MVDVNDKYKDSSHINGPRSPYTATKEDYKVFNKDKHLRQTMLFSLALGFLLMILMPIKYLISEFLIISEANDDIDTEEM